MSRDRRIAAADLAIKAGESTQDMPRLLAACIFFECWIEHGGDETQDRFKLMDESKAKVYSIDGGKEMIMPKFRKKPVVIEAVQYFRYKVGEEPLKSHPGIALCQNTNRYYVITIHEERAHLSDGDWIIPEPKEGRFYPCKPDIFAATYEPAED